MRRATLDLLLGVVLALLATVGVAATTTADAVAYGYDGAAGTHVAASEGVASPLGSAEVADSWLASMAGTGTTPRLFLVAPRTTPGTAIEPMWAQAPNRGFLGGWSRADRGRQDAVHGPWP